MLLHFLVQCEQWVSARLIGKYKVITLGAVIDKYKVITLGTVIDKYIRLLNLVL